MDDEIKYPQNKKDQPPPLSGQAMVDFLEKFRWYQEHGDVNWEDRVPRPYRDCD